MNENTVISQSIPTANRMFRYPGLKPFSQEQENIFFGRSEDIESIYRSVLQNACTVIFGKSGIGKSSIINAGLLPKIEKQINQNTNNDQYYSVFRFRFGAYGAQDTGNTLNDKLNATNNKKNENSAKEFLSNFPDEMRQTLWFKLKTQQYLAQIQSRRETFILFIDQLEEIFTYPSEQIRQFLFSLSDLLSQNLPDNVRDILDDLRAEKFTFSEAALSALHTALPVKFLFAIRSDKLNLITRLSKAIPSILQNMYELLPLSKRQAIDTIKLPAESAGDFATPPFTYDNEALRCIVDYLDQANSDPVISYEGRSIEPFNLQIICSHIEQKIVPEDEDKTITKEEIGSLENIIKEYFTETMKKNFPDESRRHEITEIILSKFIDSTNMIRKMVYGLDLGNNEENFEQLCETGLVRKEMRSAKEIYYELSHDRLLFAIIETQKEVTEIKKTENLQKAYEEIKNIEIQLQQNPDDHNLYKQLGDAYSSAKDYKNSISYYTVAIEIAAGKHAPVNDLLRVRADAYYYLGDIEASNRDYEQILAAEPDDLSANFYMAYNYYSTGQYESAEKYYTKVLEIDSQNIPANYNIGLIAEQHKDYERAIAQYEYILSLEPKYENALIRLSNIYYDHFKNYTVAEKYLLQTTEINPQAADAYFNLGLIYRKTDQEKAISSFKKSLEINPKDSEACYYLASIYSDSNEYEKAMYYFTRCTDLNPSNATAWNKMGQINYNFFNDYEKARNYYENALKADPEFTDVYFNLGLAEMKAGNLDKAAEYFEHCISRNQDDKDAYKELASVYKKQKKYESANTILLKYIELFGEDATVYNSIGVNYYIILDDEHAIQYYEKALALDSNFGDAWYNLGLSCKALGRFEKAIEGFEKAVTANPKDFEAYSHLGDVYEKKGDTDKAIENYSAALKINPDYVQATEKLNALQVTGQIH